MRATGEDMGASWRRRALFLLAFGLGLRLLFCFLVYPRVAERLHWWHVDDGHDLLAANLLEGNGFRFNDSVPPNLTNPPGYAFFLASIYRLTGIGLNEGWRIWIPQSLLDTATIALILLLSLRIFGSRRAALVTGAIYAVYPQMIAYCARPFGEVLATFLLMLALTVATWMDDAGAPEAPRTAPLLRTALAAGVLFGLAALVKEKILPFPLLLAPILAFRWRGGPADPRRTVALVLLLVGTAMAVSPWIARGYAITGKIMPITSRTGRALHWGLVSDYGTGDSEVEHANPSGRQDTLKWAIIYPPAPEGDQDFSQPRSRLDRDDALFASALRLIRERPLSFLRSSLTKAVAVWFWGQPSVLWVNFVIQIPLLVLAVWGVVLTPFKRRAVIPVVLVLYFAGIHALLVARMRYSLPVMPVVIAFAGYTLARMTERPEANPPATASS